MMKLTIRRSSFLLLLVHLAAIAWLPAGTLGQQGSQNGTATSIPQVVVDEIDRCGSPFDAHLHLESQWFTPDNAQPLLAGMTASGVDQGILMGVYGPVDVIGVDPNEGVTNFVTQSDGRLFGLASLNTTGDDWEAIKDTELTRLRMYMEMDGFVAAKVAPPHTRLPLNSTIMGDIIETVSTTSKPILAVHVGTTPFCGPFGDAILGERGLCTPEFVDPLYLEDYIAAYPGVTFVMMHGGQDFAGSPVMYNGTNFDHTIELMGKYDNMYLEISGMLSREPPPDFDTFSNPLAYENIQKVVDGGFQSRTLYGSDSDQFPGGILSYLHSTVVTLIEVGFTEDERCNTLVNLPKMVYGIKDVATQPPATAPTSAPSGAFRPGLLISKLPLLYVALAMASCLA